MVSATIMVRKILSATIIIIVLTILGIIYVLGGDNVRKEVANSSVATTESSRDKSSTSNDIIIMTTTQPTRPTVTSSGYVLALDYWEQQTSALRNLQNLQCWAAQYNLSVVEPAMSNSRLRTPLNNQSITKKRFWLRDVFDIEMWNRLSLKKHHSVLVSWEKFLSSAPKDVILATIKCALPHVIEQNLKRLSKKALTPFERVQQGCSITWHPVKEFLHKHHFNVVKEVCFNFAYGDKLSNKQFNSILYDSLSPSSTTLVFSQWRGTATARIHINDTECGNARIQEEIGPSQQLQKPVELYQQTYLMGRPYIAIIARMEKVQIFLKSRLNLTVCFSKLLSVWRETKENTGLNTTLLAIDLGKYGSSSIQNAGKGSEMDVGFKNFFNTLYYGQDFTLHDWEESFKHVAHTTDSGYVAMIQKMLVVEAQCVVFIGGGSFQKHAQTLYVHSHHKKPCIRVIEECTNPTSLYNI